jgi:prophage antirepressor-like protein
MNEIANVFNYNGYVIRAVVRDEEPWFVAADAADALRFSRASDPLRMVDEEDKSLISQKDALLQSLEIGPRGVVIVNESGLFQIIFQSNRPDVRRFKKWVTSEVLPAIRKTGSYGVAERTVPQNFTEALRLAYEQSVEIDKLQIENKTQQLQLEEVKPKVDLHDSIMDLEGLYLVDDVAKMLHFKVQTFRDFCRKEKVFILKNGSPSAAMINKGYMDAKITTGFNGINE